MVKASKDPEFKKDMEKMSLMPYVIVGEEFNNHMYEFAKVVGPIIKKLGLYK